MSETEFTGGFSGAYLFVDTSDADDIEITLDQGPERWLLWEFLNSEDALKLLTELEEAVKQAKAFIQKGVANAQQ